METTSSSSTSVRTKKRAKSKFGKRKQRKRSSCIRVKKSETNNKTEGLSVKDFKRDEKKQELSKLLLKNECKSDDDGQSNLLGEDSSGFQQPPSPTSPIITSRSKRLRATTTYTVVSQTDRKTRSTSISRHQPSCSPNTLNLFKSECSTSAKGVRNDSCGSESIELNSNTFSIKTELCSNGESETESVAGTTGAVLNNNVESCCTGETNHLLFNETKTYSKGLNESMKNKEKEGKEEIDATKIESLISQGKVECEGSSKDDEAESDGLEDKNGGQNHLKFLVDTNITVGKDVNKTKDSSGAVQAIGRESSGSAANALHLDNNVTETNKGVNAEFGGVISGSSKKVKLVEERKRTAASMLLMNNLPYMGELTFDNRPRRGRKPKKVDICHLISKNYGIHFPNSYVNVPYTGPPVPSTKPSETPYDRKASVSCSTNKDIRHGKKTSLISSSVSICPPSTASWAIVPSNTPPALLPLKQRLNSPSSSSSATKHVLSLNRPSCSSMPSKNVLNKSAVVKSLTQSISTNSRSALQQTQRDDGVCRKNENVHDEPLNLCVRDSSIVPQSKCNVRTHRLSNLINSNNNNNNYSELVNLKLPLLSANLFRDFQLKPSQTIGPGNKVIPSVKRKNQNQASTNRLKAISESSNKGENRVSDQSLVNTYNFQLNTNHSASGLSISNKALKKFKSVSHTNISAPTVCQKNEGKRVRKRKPNTSVQPEFYDGDGDYEGQSTKGSLFGHSDSGPNSNAQVSICKFKFTGGAKPSLQEKKMLSVDSGGNFRFYTDKDKVGGSQLGKNQGATSSSSIGLGESRHDREQDFHYAYASLPKSAKSMSVCMPVRPASLDKQIKSVSDDLGPDPIHAQILTKLQASLDTSQLLRTTTPTLTPATQDLNNFDSKSCSKGATISSPGGFQLFPVEDGYSSSQSSESGPSQSGSSMMCNSELQSGLYNIDSELSRSRRLRLKRKRRTRKSLMREKLEKTFKEKGFLIQTQQLESAEGATYCKFRQLRKFTRYLFRSWKDYLPDNVKEINSASGSGQNPGGMGNEWRDPNLATAGDKGDDESPEMEQDHSTTSTTNFQGMASEDSVGDDEDDDEEDETRMDLMPEVTVTITQPFSPASNPGSEGSENNVDVVHIDDNKPPNIISTTKPQTISKVQEYKDNEFDSTNDSIQIDN